MKGRESVVQADSWRRDNDDFGRVIIMGTARYSTTSRDQVMVYGGMLQKPRMSSAPNY